MSNKYNSNIEIFCLSTQVVFFHSVMERESPTLEQSKKSMSTPEKEILCKCRTNSTLEQSKKSDAESEKSRTKDEWEVKNGG